MPEKEGGVWISWAELIKLNNDLASLKMEQSIQTKTLEIMKEEIRFLKETMKEDVGLLKATMKEDIGILRDNQLEVKIMFARGKGAFYVLMLLGVIVGALFGFGKDIFLKLWRP